MNNNLTREGENNFLYTTRPQVKGKFIYCGNEKFFIKGVTYGTFAPSENHGQFPPEQQLDADFRQMSDNGFNSVRTYTVPPTFLLNAASRHNLRVMVGLPWEQHIAFLDDDKRVQNIIANVTAEVKACRQHPAILCFTIGNEIPAPVVRWYGAQRIESFLKKLYNAVKTADPGALVTYVNYPTTEYLNLSFLDFYSFNVYLENEEKLHAYLMRLHNLCDNLPLVLAEIGLDSQRNGTAKQASTLSWQATRIFDDGCAGLFVFAWTDEWWRGGSEIMDWDFGLVSRARQPKPALQSVASTLRQLPLGKREEKMISVVVCSYNGAATIAECIEGILKLKYSNYEVIVVDDGSTDKLADIVKQYPVKLISTPNRGLSNARNLGMSFAQGEIVAYIDDDAFPCEDWLSYLNIAFANSEHAAIGGPNLVPAEDGKIAKCIACSPGGPVHVLLSDEIAEHIPGCNMAFRRNVLIEIGGFDPVYRAAGDDVDICWRVQHEGYTIGFHPAAIVWHHRRNSIQTYWKQQKGYGKAEALLEKKWPERYNSLGHFNWSGSIYGNSNTSPLQLNKKKIAYGKWGSNLFQSVYQPGGHYVFSIPLMPEWYLVSFLLGILSIGGIFLEVLQPMWIVFAISVTIPLAQSFKSAQKNIRRFPELRGKTKYLLVTTSLHFIQPVARLIGRLKNGLTPWRERGVVRTDEPVAKVAAAFSPHWSEKWRSADDWLSMLESNLLHMKTSVKTGGEFDAWDLQVTSDLFTKKKLQLLVEEHGGGKQYVRLNKKTHFSTATKLIATVLLSSILIAAVAQQYYLVAALLGMAILIAGRVLHSSYQANRTIAAAWTTIDDAEKLIKDPAQKRSVNLLISENEDYYEHVAQNAILN